MPGTVVGLRDWDINKNNIFSTLKSIASDV